MQVTEIMAVELFTRTNGGPLVPENWVAFWMPSELEARLMPILAPYGQSPEWFIDRLHFRQPPAPWAFAFLDHEYALAGHVATSRPASAGIRFAPYRNVPEPMPDDYIPGVGVLVFESKVGLQASAGKSPLFAAAWNALRDCSPEKWWLAILDPLPGNWLTEVLPDDEERWLSIRPGRVHH